MINKNIIKNLKKQWAGITFGLGSLFICACIITKQINPAEGIGTLVTLTVAIANLKKVLTNKESEV